MSFAHQEGLLYFHGLETFLQPMVHETLIQVGDLLEKGTMINHVVILPPNTFLEACQMLSDVVKMAAWSQSGKQYILLEDLETFAKKGQATPEEMIVGMKYFLRQLNMMMDMQRQSHIVEFLIDEQSLLATMIQDLKMNDPEVKNWIQPQMTKKTQSSWMQLKPFRFTIGTVTLNLGQIALLCDGSERKFIKLLNQRLETCFDALMCCYYGMLKTCADSSPVHWQYGILARLDKEDVLDSLLLSSAVLQLMIAGLEMACCTLFADLQQQKQFADRICDKIGQACRQRCHETGLQFYFTIETAICVLQHLAKLDQQKFNCASLSYLTSQN